MRGSFMDSERLAGKVAIVTAAGSGIGRASVQAFARAHVQPDKLKIVVVGRADEIQPQLGEIAPVTVIRPGGPIPPPPQKKDPPT